MRLTDLMSAAGLSLYPQIALVLFLLAFMAIASRLFGRSRSAEFDRWASMALDDDARTPKGDAR